MDDARKWSFHDSCSFFDRNNLIAFRFAKLRDHSAGPRDFDVSIFGCCAQSEMQSRILCRLVAHPAFSLVIRTVSRSDLYTRAQRRRDSTSCRSAKFPASDWHCRRRCAEVAEPAPLLFTRMSRSPSLSKSAIAAPRLTRGS